MTSIHCYLFIFFIPKICFLKTSVKTSQGLQTIYLSPKLKKKVESMTFDEALKQVMMDLKKEKKLFYCSTACQSLDF